MQGKRETFFGYPQSTWGILQSYLGEIKTKETKYKHQNTIRPKVSFIITSLKDTRFFNDLFRI
jgi:hypothetical protein